RDLDQLKPSLAKPEYAPLRDVEHGLLPLSRVGSTEGPVFHLGHELTRRPILDDPQLLILDCDPELTRIECADEHKLLGILADVDEPSSSRQSAAEPADVQVALTIGLCQAQKGR